SELRIVNLSFERPCHRRDLRPFPTRRSSDLADFDQDAASRNLKPVERFQGRFRLAGGGAKGREIVNADKDGGRIIHRLGIKLSRPEEHTSELQSRENLVSRLLLEKTKARLHR